MSDLTRKRRELNKTRPICPKCGENFQIQLKEWIDRVVWKCRSCKAKF